MSTNFFERTAFGLDRNQSDRVNVFVTRRKDGKYKARYAFDRAITKICTRQQLKADHDSGRYRLVGVDAMEVI